MSRDPTVAEYVAALGKLPRPSPKLRKLLSVHLAAPKYAMTAQLLSAKVGYADYRGFNAAYGHCGRRLCRELGRPEERIGILVDFLQPRELTNRHWIAFLKPQFASALKKTGWHK
jgi:hypothetical protein